MATSKDLFARALGRPQIDLGEAALAIAADFSVDFDGAFWLARLDELGVELERRCLGAAGDLERLAALVQLLFVDYRLEGNSEDYYDPRNSFLDQVLDRRLGIPISLSVVAMEVGRRAGVPLEGIGFPGHFLLRHALHHEILLDPFDGGRWLTHVDCAELLARLSTDEIPFDRQLLRPASRIEIVQRMLNNLLAIYLRRREFEEANLVVERLHMLAPGDPRVRRNRGLIRLHRGEVQTAVEDLEGYLDGVPDASDRDQIEALIRDVTADEPVH